MCRYQIVLKVDELLLHLFSSQKLLLPRRPGMQIGRILYEATDETTIVLGEPKSYEVLLLVSV